MNLEEHSFIQSIPQSRRDAIMQEIEVTHLVDAQVIFSENSVTDALYLILSGSVAFTKEKIDGRLQNVSVSEAGNFFGEVGVLTGETRALGARAKGPCVIARIPIATVNKIIEDAGPLRRILESVIEHLKSTTDHYMDEVMRTEKLSLVGTMVSSLLHDFKNPFAVISLGSGIIHQQYRDDPKVSKVCLSIESQIRRMVNMANDLAAFARGDHRIEVEHIELDSLFEQVEDLQSHLHKEPPVALVLKGNQISLEGDINKLLRLLQNLVNNAIEAIHNANIQAGSVQVEASESGDKSSVLVKVMDNGPGIPESIRSDFFEPFVTQGKKEGTGLGTAIAKSIVDAHHGDIRFETGANGTTMIIRLPKSQALVL